MLPIKIPNIQTNKGEFKVTETLGSGMRGSCLALVDQDGKEFAGFIRDETEVTPNELAIYDAISELDIPITETHLTPLIERLPLSGGRMLFLHPRFTGSNVNDLLALFKQGDYFEITSTMRLEHPLTYEQTKLYLHHIATALDILHTYPSLGYVHKDLGLTNTFAAQADNNFFLGDYHLAEKAGIRNMKDERRMFAGIIKTMLVYPFLYDKVHRICELLNIREGESVRAVEKHIPDDTCFFIGFISREESLQKLIRLLSSSVGRQLLDVSISLQFSIRRKSSQRIN